MECLTSVRPNIRFAALKKPKCKLMMALFFFWCSSQGCISSEGLFDGRTDPDLERDINEHNLCDPTGKRDVELARCHEQNQAYFATFEEEAKKREPWFNFPRDNWLDSIPLDGKYVVEAVDITDVLPRLERIPIVELSPEEARKISGKNLSFPGRRPYLVRSLVYAKKGGIFNVFEKDTSIFVRHEVEGAQPDMETRQALVLWLPYKPKDLFVDCQVFN